MANQGFLLLLFFISTNLPAQETINMQSPPATAEIFAPGIISTGLGERDFALSPDGRDLYYTLQSAQGIFQTIVHRTRDKNGNWSAPVIADFAGHYSDLEPAFSDDGKKLFFSSNRPLAGDTVKDFDIWVVEKTDAGWGVPKNIGSPINTVADEFYPSITSSGNLYFTAAYKNGIGKEDIYISKWVNGKYLQPAALDSNVNSTTYEFNAFVSPAEDIILFSSYGRKDDKGRGDLYISTKSKSGNWQPAKNIGFLNSPNLDYCPFLSSDKKILFFTSERNNLKDAYPGTAATYDNLKRLFTSPGNGAGDIYWVDFAKVLQILE